MCSKLSTLYENIKFHCERVGITGAKLCNDAGVSKSTLTSLKNGRTKKINTDNLLKIADRLGVSVDDLLGYGQEETTVGAGTLYRSIKDLCEENGVKPGKMCSDTKISRGLITDLKMGRKSTITIETAQKIADYFGVSVDRVLGTEQKEMPTGISADGLTEDQKKAIDKILSLSPEALQKKMAALEAVIDM